MKKKCIKYLTCASILLTILLPNSKAQEINNSRISFDYVDVPLSDALVDLSVKSDVNIFFSEELVRNHRVTISGSAPFEQALSRVLYGRDIYYKKINSQIVLFKAIRSKRKFSISGYIEDDETGERLIGAGIFDFVTARGGESNQYGFYSISLPEGEVDIAYQYLGYETVVERFNLNKDISLNITLKPSLTLEEIVVYADSISRLTPIGPGGKTQVTQAKVSRMATLGGELDVYRYMEILPGINTGTDGVGGIHVRGGSDDQNLILMDGVPIYNPAHMIGIFSVFNAEAINRMDIYKANFPARYGGRLSSVIDIHTREGNKKEFKAGAKIGLASVGAFLEGPLIKDKSSFLITGRWFLPSIGIKGISRRYKDRQGTGGYTFLNFYDLNAKWNYAFSDRDKIYLSFFQGRDQFQDVTNYSAFLPGQTVDPFTGEILNFKIESKIDTDKNVNWGNRIAILRWNHQIGDKIFMNNSISYNKYTLQSLEKLEFRNRFRDPVFQTIQRTSGFDNQEFKTSIVDWGYKLDIDYLPSIHHRLKLGLSLVSHNFLPKSITFNEELKFDDFFFVEGTLENEIFNQFRIRSAEWSLYAEDNWTVVNNILSINGGVHLSGFNVRDKGYLNPQGRFLLNFTPGQKLSLQVGMSQMTQYLHLLTNSGIGLPTDLWVPSTEKVKPQESFQYSGTITYQPKKWLQLRVEAYHKKLKNLITYQEGASFLVPAGAIATSVLDAGNWEDKVTSGTGESYGIESEISIQKKKWQTNVSYSYAIANRTFADVNFGKTYPYRYNRKHSVSLATAIDIGDRLTVKANWIFGTGNHITLAESKFESNNELFPIVGLNFSERNGFELPDYHRLDLAAEWEIGKSSSQFSQHIFLDIYNIYNRTNPFYISLVEDPFTQEYKQSQYSIFGFLPSIGYSIKFQ